MQVGTILWSFWCSMGKIRIIQHKCSEGHCIMAALYDSRESSFESAVDQLKEAEKRLNVHPWCGVCGSTKLRFEDRETMHDDLDEAIRAAREIERQNLETMAKLNRGPRLN